MFSDVVACCFVRLAPAAPAGSVLSQRTLLSPDRREFWEKLSGWVEPGEDGGVDIFSPLAASGKQQARRLKPALMSRCSS